MTERCTNCTALEARYVEQEERILRLTTRIARGNPDSQGVSELMATNNSENRMLGKRLMNAERRAEKAEAIVMKYRKHNPEILDRYDNLYGPNAQDVAMLRGQLTQTQAQTTSWYEAAKQYARNADYYRSLVVEIGELFGQEAQIADDGSIMEDVLCAKVPSLVQKMQAAVAELRDVLVSIEWINVGGTKRCPECWRTPGDGHAWNPPCVLALALTRAKQEVGEP